jgi:beta-lactamase regulating signal transducer with metallopeptidase domain
MSAAFARAVLVVSQSPEMSLVLKATALMVLGLLAARLASPASASFRHLTLAATFIALLILPVAATIVPEMKVGVAVPVSAIAITGGIDAAPVAGAQTPRPSTPEGGGVMAPRWLAATLRLVWICGTALLLTSVALVLWRLRRLRRTGLPWPEMRKAVRGLAVDSGITRSVDVLLHEAVASPITFGTRHPVIVLPPGARTWSDADLRRALVHELEHVRRGDWALQTMARAVCAVWWFQPFVWVLWRRLSLDAERACDDAVIAKEEDMAYAEQLVSLAARLSAARAQPTLGMANRSDLSARVSSLLDPHQRRGRAGAGAVSAALAVALVAGVAVAPLRAVPRRAMVPAAVATGDQNRNQDTLDRQLYEAAEAGDVDRINQFLQSGARIDAVLQGDGSPLIAAARAGNLDAARLLLDKGADPNLAVPGDGSPLIAAAAQGRTGVAALLLQRGAQVDFIAPDDENALIRAAAEGHLDVVRLLVASGADVNARVRAQVRRASREEWRTPLGMARRGGHTPVVRFLVSAGAQE